MFRTKRKNWIDKSFREINKEGRGLWKQYVKPYLGELKKDRELQDFLSLKGSEDLLDPKHGEIFPSFPMELALQRDADEILTPAECTKEILKYYVVRGQMMLPFDFGLDVAIAKGKVDVSKPWGSHCTMCGSCCTGAGGAPALTPEDNRRIVEFFKTTSEPLEGWDGEEENLVQTLEDILFLVEECLGDYLQIDGNLILIDTCPFLERLNSKTNLCIIDPVKPEFCARHFCWLSAEEMQKLASEKEHASEV